MKYIASCLAAALMLSACAIESSNQSSGYGRVRMNVQWPQQGFAVKAIPLTATTLVVRISGAGIIGQREEKIERSQGQEQSLDLALPTGPKRVEVLALDGRASTVARAGESVMIERNQTARLVLNLQPEAIATPTPQGPTPTPNPSGGGSGSGNSGSGNSGGTGEPGSGNEPTPGDSASPGPSADPTAQPSSAPSPEPSTHSGSGGSSSNDVLPLRLSADPNPISGVFYPTEIRVASTRDNLDPQSFTWSCVDSGDVEGCGSFHATSDPLVMIWRAPGTSGIYRIRLVIDDGERPVISDEIEVTVTGGSGSVAPGDAGFDGGTN